MKLRKPDCESKTIERVLFAQTHLLTSEEVLKQLPGYQGPNMFDLMNVRRLSVILSENQFLAFQSKE